MVHLVHQEPRFDYSYVEVRAVQSHHARSAATYVHARHSSHVPALHAVVQLRSSSRHPNRSQFLPQETILCRSLPQTVRHHSGNCAVRDRDREHVLLEEPFRGKHETLQFLSQFGDVANQQTTYSTCQMVPPCLLASTTQLYVRRPHPAPAYAPGPTAVRLHTRTPYVQYSWRDVTRVV